MTKKERQKKHARKHYLKNKDIIKKRAKKYNKKQSKILKNFVNTFKLNKGCVKCKYNKCVYALEFHHVKKNKEFAISRQLHSGMSLKTLQKEMDKCIVLCANCHRELHYGD